MLYIDVKIGSRAALGRRGENKARTIRFDIREWQQLYGEGTIELLHRRGCDAIPYPCAIEVNGNYVDWPITNIDTSYCSNRGQYELVYTVGDIVVKTAIGNTYVEQSLDDPSEELPDPVKGYLEQILQASSVASESARDAAASKSAAAQSCNDAKLSEQNAKASENASAASAAEAKKAEGVKSVNGKYPDENWNVNILAWEENVTLREPKVIHPTSTVFTLSPTFEIIDGDRYTVTIDDAVYNCRAFAHTDGQLWAGFSIGNPVLADKFTDEPTDNGMPFIITYNRRNNTTSMRFNDNQAYYGAVLSVAHNIVHCVDEHLLPRVTDLNTGIEYVVDALDCKPYWRTANNCFDCTINNANREQIGYSDSVTDLIIPEYFVDDMGLTRRVVSIGGGAFENCTNLASVVIPDSVTSIGYQAFGYCSNLTSVVLPSSLRSIDTYAFRRCSSLQSIDIPPSVQSIGDYAFVGCSALTNVKLPDSLEYLSYAMFQSCTSLQNVKLPSNLRSIANSAFGSCANLSSIYIPYGVHTLGNAAFANCTSLADVSLPCSLRSIADKAFYECASLTSIDIPSSVVSIGQDALRHTGLNDIRIPASVVNLGRMALAQCGNLTSAVIDANINYIETNMFYECTKLLDVTLPKGLSEIRDNVFYGCTKLDVVHYAGTKEEWDLITFGTYNTYAQRAQKVFCCKAADVCAAPIDHVHKDMIVSSATPGSTKNFRITVDDAGTITATEATT